MKLSWKSVCLVSSLSLFSGNAFAYYSVMSTGEILPENQYTLTAETQFVSEPSSGVNVSGRFESGITESSGFRGQFGVGKTDLFLSALYKYVPYPDIEGQPAVGFNAGVIYANDAGLGEYSLRFEPLVSKKVEMSFGHLIPYGSVPLSFQHRTRRSDQFGNDRNDVAIQVVAGTEIAFSDLKGLRFMPEVGLNLDNAPTYVSVGALFDFDEEGFTFGR